MWWLGWETKWQHDTPACLTSVVVCGRLTLLSYAKIFLLHHGWQEAHLTAHGLQIQRASRERASQRRQRRENSGPQPWKQAYDAAAKALQAASQCLASGWARAHRPQCWARERDLSGLLAITCMGLWP